MRNNTAAKIIATIIVLVIAFIYVERNDLLDPVADAFEHASGGSTPVDNPVEADLNPADLIEALGGIEVSDAADIDYDREGQFGADWLDTNDNGCSTRNDILARDLQYTDIDSDGCTVLTGLLIDPYTGDSIDFTRGQSTSMAVQIDHVVPLSLAARHGALDWTEEDRIEFANDPINLLAVDGATNEAKSDLAVGEWLPPNEAFHCEFVSIYVNVVDTYGLSMPASDAEAAEQVLAGC